jgi:hypothetical protein
MSLSQAQLDTVNGISPKGFHIDSGTPCECGSEDYTTTKERGFSDSMIYKHRCGNCGNFFRTFIEG